MGERSSSSSGSVVTSKNYTFPRGKLDGFLGNNANDLWSEKQMTLLFQDFDQDPPLWDMDIKDPSCAWDLELGQKLATKLLIQNGEESLNEDNFNPYVMPHQVMYLANLRKMGLSDSNPSGESSGSEDGKLPFSRGPDYDLQHYLLAREEFLGLEKFPTFVPRGSFNNFNQSQFGAVGNVGPVGSGRPRVVWPGA